MVKMFFCVLLTFVLGVPATYAAPYSNEEEQEEVIEEDQETTPPDFDSKNVTPAKVPKKPAPVQVNKGEFDPAGYFFPYTQSLSMRSGLFVDINEITNTPDLEFILGMNYMVPRYYSPHWEVGVDLSSTGNGHLHAGMKVTLNEKGAYRPFYKVGVLHMWIPDERLASFTNWENYMALFSFGLEDMIKPPKSVRLEVELAAGTDAILFMLVAGASWGF